MGKITKYLLLDGLFRGEGSAILSAVSLVVSISLIFESKISWDFLLVIFLLATAIYFFDFFDDSQDDNLKYLSEKKVLVKKSSLFKTFTFALLLICFLLVLYFGNYKSIIFLLLMIAAGLFYPTYFKPLTKKYCGFKDIYVALAWNIFSINYFIYYSFGFSWGLVVFLVFMFLRDLMGASYCDIKDIDRDKNNSLKTLVVILGTSKYFVFNYLLNITSIIFLIIGVTNHILPPVMIYLLIPICITFALISISRKLNRYPSLIIDIEYILWMSILLIVRALHV
jgi:4-hydroxybenzoate polyprenyltransferase